MGGVGKRRPQKCHTSPYPTSVSSNTELTRCKLLTARLCVTGFKQLYLGLCDHAPKSLWAVLIQFSFQVPQRSPLPQCIYRERTKNQVPVQLHKRYYKLKSVQKNLYYLHYTSVSIIKILITNNVKNLLIIDKKEFILKSR